MREVFWVMLSLSLSGAGLAAVVALLQRLLAKRLPAGLFYGLWAAVLLRMIVPAGPLGGVSHEAVSRLEALAQASAVQAQGQTVWQSTALTGTPGGAGARGILWLAVVWGAGAAGLLLWRLWSYRCFCKAVDSRSRPASPEIREQLLPLAGQRGRLPELVECGGVGAPMLLGLRRPRIVLPAGDFSPQQIRDMLAHEMVHFERRDLAFKWAAVVVTALHWPNPAAWYALRQMGIFCELSCDERLTKSWPALRRAAYGALLLRLSQGVPERETPLSASFSEQKERLKERLKTIMTPKNTGKKTTLLTAAVLAAVLAGRSRPLPPEPLRSRRPAAGVLAFAGAVCMLAAGAAQFVLAAGTVSTFVRILLEVACAVWLSNLGRSWLRGDGWKTPAGGLPVAIAGSALFYWNVLMRFMENSSSWHRVQPTAAVWQELAALLFLAALARTLYLPRPENGRSLHAAALAAFCLCLCWELPRVLLLLAAGFGGGMAAVLPELLSGLALCCIGGMGLACIGQGKAGNN